MAANLNKPADFVEKTSRSKSREKFASALIPPSEFEKPIVTHRRELDKAKKQIQDLKEENEKLQLIQSQAQQQTAVTSFSSSHNEYADELIKRQANEIAELRLELSRCRQAYDQDTLEWDRKWASVKEEHQREVSKLQLDFGYKEDEFEQRLHRVSAELERVLEDTKTESTSLKEKLEMTQTSLGGRVQELEDELREAHSRSEIARKKLETELRSQTCTLEGQADEISKLKAYISESAKTYRPAQVLQTEKQTVENMLKLSEAENQKLQSELQLTDVRFKAMSNILAVQEAELSQAKTDGTSKAKQHDLIIKKWREKVYALLVQNKSADIVNRNDLNNFQQKMKSVEGLLSVSEVRADVLQHSVEDKTAQLQIEVNSKQMLRQQLEQAQEAAFSADEESRMNRQSLQDLCKFLQRNQDKNNEITAALEEKSNSLKVLGQRVSFAASRMELLKAQLVRKSAMSMNLHNESKKSLSVSRGDEDVSRDSEEHLYQELERVMQERDSLATQVRHDSTKWSQRLTETHSQYNSEIRTLKKTVEDLEYDVQRKTKTCDQLSKELETLKEDLQEKDDTLSQLQAELSRHMKGVDTVLTDQKLKDEAEFSTKLAEMDRKLNESKREHAKAVLSLRQMERTHGRELERERELLTISKDHFTKQLQQVQSQLVSVEKERNIMMATLRQEGLTSKLKSERWEPVRLQLNEEERTSPQPCRNDTELNVNTIDKVIPPVNTKGAEETPVRDGDMEFASDKGTHEPVENVLKDLKSLTAAIFEDNDDEDIDSMHGNDSHNRSDS